MNKDEYFAYDILEIPEYIKKMTEEELDAEIARIEAEIAEEKRKRSQRDRKVEK